MAASVEVIRAAIAPGLEGAGVDLEAIEVQPAGRREIIRVIVDRDGGVDLDLIADLSRVISEALDSPDVAAALAGSYVLEVTSPGVDRPLTAPRHWRRAVGRLVSVQRTALPPVQGRVVDASEEDATIRLSDGDDVRVAYADVANAQVQIEFHRHEEAD